MSSVTLWLGYATVFTVSFALVAVQLMLFGATDRPGRVAARHYMAALDRKLAFLRSRLRGWQILAGQVAAGILVAGGALGFGYWQFLPALPLIVIAPKILVDVHVSRRVARIDEQVEPWLNAVANALKASSSLGEAISSSIPLIQSPMSEEVDVLVKEYELGTPLDHALDNLAIRVGSNTLTGTVLALKVARKSGGNLPEMLENAASALRELARLEGVVRSKTAEGKAQALVIGAIPALLVALIHAIEPGFFQPLAQTFLGHLIVGGAAALWLVALLAARKILAVDV